MRLVPAHADLVTTQIHVVPMAGVALDFASMIRTCPLAWDSRILRSMSYGRYPSRGTSSPFCAGEAT